MKRRPKVDPESLQGLFRTANERAARWAEPEPWRPSSPWRTRWPLMVSLIAGLLVPGVLAGYFLAADASSGHVPAQPAALAMDRSMALPGRRHLTRRSRLALARATSAQIRRFSTRQSGGQVPIF